MTAEGRVIVLTIDGQEVRASAAATIYEASRAAGIHIPTFCNHHKLRPVGACRTCLVEIEGQRGMQTSCTTPVREGMVVRVHTSPTAVKARRANLEFLLTNHPLDCPVCDKGGECLLQDQALLDGPGKSRYIEEKRHKNKRYPLSELLILDQERCVLCWRCVRFLDEWADDHQLDRFGRGADTRIDTFPSRPLDSKWQGNTIDVCPVGALTSRIFRFEARAWELTNTPSICPMCAVGCNIFLGIKTNAVRRITPRENAAVNDVWICDKGRFTHAFVDHPDRLKTPLVRRKGELEPASWDEALDLIAQRFAQVLRDPEGGPQAIAGLGSTRVTNEANYLFQRFMRTIVGTNNIDHLGRIPAAMTPLASLPELEFKDVILLLGFDPSVAAPLVELWIKKAVLRRGARVLVANPRRIEFVRYGGPWLGYRPGSEVSLLNGLAHLLLYAEHTGGDPTVPMATKETASRGTSKPTSGRAANLDEFRTWLKPFDPDYVQRLAGVPVDAMQEAARLLARAAHPIILCGPEWLPAWARTGSLARLCKAQFDALANLTLLLGGAEAAFVPDDNNTLGALDMGVVPDLYPGGLAVQDPHSRSRLASFWGTKLSSAEGLDFEGMMAAMRDGRMKAMWVMGSDPVQDRAGAGNALGIVPFLVVQEMFLTDTASMAEVVLPAASFAEIDGSFTNLSGRVQAIHAAKRPPGEARPDWWIIAEVARRMVMPSPRPLTVKAAVSRPKEPALGSDSGTHDAVSAAAVRKQHKAWTISGPADVLDEISRVLPEYRALDYAVMGDQGWQRPAAPALSRRALVRIDPWTEQEGGQEAFAPAPHGTDYPLTLVSGRTLYDRGTWLRRSDRLQKMVPAATIVVHPKDAKKLDLANGDAVTVISAQGRLESTVKIGDEVVPGTVLALANVSDAPWMVLYADGALTAHVRMVK